MQWITSERLERLLRDADGVQIPKAIQERIAGTKEVATSKKHYGFADCRKYSGITAKDLPPLRDSED